MSNPNNDRQNGGWNTDWRGNFSPSGNPNSSNTNSYVPNRLVSADPVNNGPDCGTYKDATYINESKSNCSCPADKMKKSKPEGILNGKQGFKFWCSANSN
jgi:hypothetical protein